MSGQYIAHKLDQQNNPLHPQVTYNVSKTKLKMSESSISEHKQIMPKNWENMQEHWSSEDILADLIS